MKLPPEIRKAMDQWWTPLTRQGDPQLRPYLLDEAFKAGYLAGQRAADSEQRIAGLMEGFEL